MRHSVRALIVAGAVLITSSTDCSVVRAAAATRATAAAGLAVAPDDGDRPVTRPELPSGTTTAPGGGTGALFVDLAVLGGRR